MPLLPTFTAQAGSLPISGGRRAAAEDIASAPGDLTTGVTSAANAYLADAEEKESRKALIASSEVRAKYARELDAAQADGRDLGALKAQMQDELAKVGEGFQTRRGQETLAFYSANSELMYDEQANRITVARAAEEARADGTKFISTAGAIIQSNPLYLKEAEASADDLVATFTKIPTWKRAELADTLKKSLNMTAAIAASRINPDAAKKDLQSGKWNLTPEQRTTAIDKAETEIRARRAEDAYFDSQRQKALVEADGKARDKHFSAIIGGTATRRAIMDDADLLPATREHMINVMEIRAKAKIGEEKQSDPTVKRDLWLAIHAPDGDPKKIYNADSIFAAVKAGTLNTTDANQLNMLVAGQKDENNRTFGVRLQGRISTVAAAMRSAPEYQAQPELAAAIQLELAAQVEKKATALRRENKDPSGLLDPESKDYYFKPGIIKQVADDVKRQKQAAMPQMPTVRTQAEYDALEPGTAYIDAQGNSGVKKGPKKAAPAPAFPIQTSGDGARRTRGNE